MFTVDAKLINFNLQNETVIKYLFSAEWRKLVIDAGYHNYGGFTRLLKTTNNEVFNTSKLKKYIVEDLDD